MTPVRSSMAQTIAGGIRPLFSIDDSPDRREQFIQARLQMYDFVQNETRKAISEQTYRLRISYILKAHKIGFNFLFDQAGHVRRENVSIGNSKHLPPAPDGVMPLLEEMCEYINDNWNIIDFSHIAAFFMWRLLWIHPFVEGNGSVARLLAYSLIQIKAKSILPGIKALPERIADNRNAYYCALAEADTAYAKGKIDVSALETLLQQLLSQQLEEWLGRVR